jgi:hypothetical protein
MGIVIEAAHRFKKKATPTMPVPPSPPATPRMAQPNKLRERERIQLAIANLHKYKGG